MLKIKNVLKLNGCDVQPVFNTPSYPPMYCSQHKKDGMICKPY